MAEWSKKSVWKKTSFVRDYYMKAYKSEITRQKEYAEKEKAWREKEGLA